MELRHFAEQVLFGTSLMEKLRRPASITDEQPGAAVMAPEMPGRPAELCFKRAHSGKGDFPSLRRLEDAGERGRLLHFFANHELLATELMALVLLRFPDAPAAFRQGVLRTLKDEQEHARWYIKRMQQCGVQFGELPVSGYFWRAISRMESPMDYVAGLSLTFEQANLDFARYFAGGFEVVGDAETARLLNRIYHDEIGHVAYGLKWFRRWKNPKESDWNAFRETLKFPLSPNRAKGVSFNVEGRKAAGFENSFIDELRVYSQSKGRTPSVFVFNPFAEGYIAQGKGFTPVKHQARLARDLENLPQFLCGQDDVVLLEKKPSVEFLGGLKKAGFALPEFMELKGWRKTLGERKIRDLRPWAWGPDSVELLEPLFDNITGESRGANHYFNDRIAPLYSKRWSAGFLRDFLASRRRESWLCEEREIGAGVDTMEAAMKAIGEIRARGHHKVVVKEALGLAGHNAIRLWEPEILETQKRWLNHALGQGRQLVVEPWLERESDFSIQLEMDKDGLKVKGYTGLINDRKGQFQANWVAPNYVRKIPTRVLSVFGNRFIGHQIQELYAEMFSKLESKLKQAGYRGPLGIDAFVYLTIRGERRLKPLVEINPRYTMGRLLVELMKRTCPGSYGIFQLINNATIERTGFESFVACASALTKRFPLRLEGEPVPKIREGTVCLNDPERTETCLAVFQVGRDLDTLLASDAVMSASSS